MLAAMLQFLTPSEHFFQPGSNLYGKRGEAEMKKLEAIVRHELLEKVRDALDKAGYHGLTISEVRGAGSQRGYTESYRGAKASIVFRPKVKLEIVVGAEQVDEVARIISESARTGSVGDGKIFVVPVDETIRIRTGEKGKRAL